MLKPFYRRSAPRPFENINSPNGPWTLEKIFSAYNNNAGCGNKSRSLSGLFDLKMTYDELLKRSQERVADSLFRNHIGSEEYIKEHGLKRNVGASEGYLQYTADILKHTARTGGSEGRVLSLTSIMHVARRFSRYNSVLVEININKADNPALYKNLSGLILENADILLELDLIKASTIVSALRGIQEFGECEVFYLGGDIPHSHIETIHQ